MKKNDNYKLSYTSSNNHYKDQNNGHKMVLYKNINENKKNNICYYYNEEDIDDTLKNQLKNGKISNKNFNNLLINGMKNKNNSNNNENKKKTSMINFVSKADKSKNLFVYKNENYNNSSNNGGFNMISKNTKNKNNYYTENTENYTENKQIPIFDIKYLKNININKFKLISQKSIELPRSTICYFNKSTVIDRQKLQLPVSNICYYDKVTLFTVEKIKIPLLNICFFNKTIIFKEKKIMQTVVNNYYFCNKINKMKNKEKLVIENCIEFDFLKSSKKMKYNNRGISNLRKRNDKINNNNNNEEKIIIKKLRPRSKKKRNKEDEGKNDEYKKKLNNRLKNYKTISHNEKMNKLNKEEEKKYKKNKKVIKKVSLANTVRQVSNFSKNKQKRFKVSKTEREPNITNNEEKHKFVNSSLSYNKTSNNKSYIKYSFYKMFDIDIDIKNKKTLNSGYDEKNKKIKKKIFQKFEENGKKNNNGINNYEKDKNIIMPIINVNMIKHTPKSKTIYSSQSSNLLIKKINSSNSNNKNSLFNIFKSKNNLLNTKDNISSLLIKTQNKNYNNNLPGINDKKNPEHKNECNYPRYDKHYGNEGNCPKCQSMDMKFNYLKEKRNDIVPNIHNKPVENSFNKTSDIFKKDNIISPMKDYDKLYLKNYNNYQNNSKNFLSKLQKNNNVVQIKKVNITKYSEQILKNYKSNFMAIKQYFNMK